MSDGRYSRRTLLKGVAAASGLAAMPALGLISSDTLPVAEAASVAPQIEGPLMAYIKDAAAGEVAFMVGTKEIVRRDPGLIRRLLGAARTE